MDAVSSAANLRLCEGLGATRVYEYATTPPAGIDDRYDGVLATGGRPAAYRHLVRPSGRLVCVAGDAWARDMLRVVPGTRPRLRLISVGPDPRDLEWLGDQVRQGALRPVVHATYPVSAIAEAHEDMASGHAHGRRVVVHPEFR